MLAVPFLIGCLDRTPETYHSVGIRRGTATSNFHLQRDNLRSHHATFQLDECRRRVQQELLGHRGRKADPLFRARCLLAMAHERLDHRGNEKLAGLLEAGDPKGEVRMSWLAKESAREIYSHSDADLAVNGQFDVLAGGQLKVALLLDPWVVHAAARPGSGGQ